MSVKPFNHPVFAALEKKRFILASTSPRRAEILQSLGIKDIEIIASSFEENLDKSIRTPEEYVLDTARGKALAVWSLLKQQGTTQDLVLLAADTIVENEGIIYEKPKIVEENARVIKKMRDSDDDVKVLTGVVMMVYSSSNADGYEIGTFVDTSVIKMEKGRTDEFVDMYAATGEGLNVAGGFKIQGFGALMMASVDGDYWNIVGLPFQKTFKLICQMLDANL